MSENQSLIYMDAKSLMKNGDFLSAMLKLKHMINNFGHDVLALIDLASCYYMLNDFLNCHKYSSIARQQLQAQREILELEVVQKASLGLGKLLEELGEVAEALEIYKSCEHCESNTFVDKIKAHQLRLLSEMNLRPYISKRYLACEQLNAKDGDREIDLQNALMEADFTLVGFQEAHHRMKELVENPKIKDFERRLLFFNFLYYTLRSQADSQLERSLFEKFNYFQCDAFEKAMWDIYLFDQGQTTLTDLTLTRSEEMSVMCGLRYLYVLHLRQSKNKFFVQAEGKIHLFLGSLSLESKNLILQHWPLFHNSDPKIICLQAVGATFEGSRLQLGKSENFQRMIRVLSGVNQMDVEEVIRKVFESDLDAYTMDRLRVTVRRLNQKVAQQLGSDSFLILNKATLKLNSRFKIQDAS